MKQDKFLTGIVIGIGVLVLLALVLYFTRQDKVEYLADDNPAGVVHNYVLAVLNKDYEKAYGYMAELDYKPTYEQFRQSFYKGMVNPEKSGVDVGSAEINGSEASVPITIYFSSSDPFSGGYQNEDHVLLVLQSGKWKISSMQYGNYWDYNWYQKPLQP